MQQTNGPSGRSIFLAGLVLLGTIVAGASMLHSQRAPTDAELLASAEAALIQNQPKVAEIALKTLLQRDGQQPALRRRLGELLLAEARYADALNALLAGTDARATDEIDDSKLLLAIIEAAAGAGEIETGLAHLQQLKTLGALDGRMLLLESELMLAKGDLDAAGALAKAGRAAGAGRARADLILACVLIRQGQLDAASRQLDRILDGDAHGVADGGSGGGSGGGSDGDDGAAAKDAFEAAADAGTEARGNFVASAGADAGTHSHDRSHARIQKSASHQETMTNARLLKAAIAFELDQPQAAEAQLARIADSLPDDPRPDLMRLEFALAKGNLETARTHWQALDTRGVSGLRMVRAGALLDFSAGQWATAKQALMQVEASGAGDLQSRLTLAELYLHDGESRAAQAILEPIVMAQPNARARQMLAESLVAQRAGSKALEVLAPLTESASSDPVLAALFGRAYLAAGAPERARDWLEIAATKTPEHGLAAAQLGLAELASQREIEGLTRLLATGQRAGRDAGYGPSLTPLIIGALLRGNRLEEALAQAYAAQRAAPNDPEPALLLGGLLLASGDLDRAENVFSEYLAEPTAAGAAQLNLARVALADGRVAAAQTRLDALLDDPDVGGEARLMLAAIEALHLQDPIAAMRTLKSAEMFMPDDPRPTLARGALALNIGQPDMARLAAAEILERAPNTSDALLLAARAELALKHPDAAYALLKRLPAPHPNDTPQQVLRAEIALARGQTPAAQAYLDALLQADHPQPESLFKAVAVALRLGDLHRGEALQVALARLDSGLAHSPLWLKHQGDLAHLRGADMLARSAWLEAFKRGAETVSSPASPAIEALTQWLEHTLEQDSADSALKALAAFKSAVLNPHCKIELTRLEARALAADGQPVRAIALAVQYLEQNPSEAQGMRDLANLYWGRREAGDARRALRFAESAVRSDPNDPDNHATFGRILLEQGQRERARKHLENALIARTDSPALTILLAQAELELGMTQPARDRLQTVLDAGIVDAKTRRDALTLMQRAERMGAASATSSASGLESDPLPPTPSYSGIASHH